MDCPICNFPSSHVFIKDGYWISDCKNCHHYYADFSPSPEHSRQVYTDKYFNGGLAGYPDYLSEAKLLSAHGRRYSSILKRYTNPGRILDVGAAAGFVLKGFTESGWDGMGLEPNLSMSTYGRTKLGLNIQTGSLEEFPADQQFDLVSMVQVIAHFFDIRKALKKAAEVTKPGGFWLVETWDKDSWIAHILGSAWHEYSPPSVLHYFSPKTLNRFVAEFGFTEVARGHPAKYLNGAHAKSLLGYKLQDSSLGWMAGGLKVIPDNISIPYPTFDLFWALYRKE